MQMETIKDSFVKQNQSYFWIMTIQLPSWVIALGPNVRIRLEKEPIPIA